MIDRMAAATHPSMEDLDLPTVMHALADPIRLGLVRLLSDGEERAWGDLDAPVANSTLSHHLKVLRSAGITRTREEGKRCFVRLRSDEFEGRFPGLLDTTLALAGEAGTGVADVRLHSAAA
ncbi:DNA-binding transcriptional regulator, ArsR family [Prauserella alba]|nr:DNA-binding transcriptional regulator, ArsR family [Prauserella alba]